MVEDAVLAKPADDQNLARRIDALDWQRIRTEIQDRGFAVTGPILSADACRRMEDDYDDEPAFRSRVVMQRHSFGKGEYKYFRYPLPTPVETMRSAFYPHLADIANDWRAMMGLEADLPPDHGAFLRRCHAAGQSLPTPLLLRYVEGDYNCLHQDLYGEHVFPLQIALLLSDPESAFSGGEFVLTEQRPRMQSRASVVPLGLGEAVIFAVNERPVQGKRGTYRVRMRHGVSQVLSGRRHVLGLIFHDAA